MSGFFIGKSHNFKMLILLKKIILCWLIKLTYSSNLPVVANFPTVRCLFYSKKKSRGEERCLFIRSFILQTFMEYHIITGAMGLSKMSNTGLLPSKNSESSGCLVLAWKTKPHSQFNYSLYVYRLQISTYSSNLSPELQCI